MRVKPRLEFCVKCKHFRKSGYGHKSTVLMFCEDKAIGRASDGGGVEPRIFNDFNVPAFCPYRLEFLVDDSVRVIDIQTSHPHAF